MKDLSRFQINSTGSIHRVVADAIGMRLASSSDSNDSRDGEWPKRWAELLAAMDRSRSPADPPHSPKLMPKNAE